MAVLVEATNLRGLPTPIDIQKTHKLAESSDLAETLEQIIATEQELASNIQVPEDGKPVKEPQI